MIKGLTPETVVALAKQHGVKIITVQRESNNRSFSREAEGEVVGILISIEDLYYLLMGCRGSER